MAEAVKHYEANDTVWDRIANSRQFKDLMATKKIFIVPAFIFFVVYYFALPVLVGYAPAFMATKVIGNVNIAYLFALSQFFVAWIIAGLYVKAANDFDRLSNDIIEKPSNRAREANSHVNSPDHVPDVYCRHTGHYLSGPQNAPLGRAHTLPPGARSKAGKTAWQWPATT